MQSKFQFHIVIFYIDSISQIKLHNLRKTLLDLVDYGTPCENIL